MHKKKPVRLPAKAAAKRTGSLPNMITTPPWHNPAVGDEIKCEGISYFIDKVEEYKNGKGKIKLVSPRGTLTLSGTLPFSGWAHLKGIAAGPKSTYHKGHRRK